MTGRSGFAAMLAKAARNLVVICLVATVATVIYDQPGSRRHHYNYNPWQEAHTPVGVTVAATNGLLIGLAVGSFFTLFQVVAWLWGGKRDGLRDLQRALETQADQAHRDGRLAEEQRLRREIADIVRDRAR
jgi:hypothetical protein